MLFVVLGLLMYESVTITKFIDVLLYLNRLELLARAPLVPWDDDLALWDKKDMAFNTSGLEYSHRFLGVGDGSNLVSQDTLDRMKMRTRIYNPELPKEIKVCSVCGFLILVSYYMDRVSCLQ